MIRYKLDKTKMLEGIIWLANRMPGITQYQIAKMFFFADRMHLNNYGRPIFGDVYCAMENGPVPSATYDAIKQDLLGDSISVNTVGAKKKLTALRPADLDEFSDTDIKVLEAVFEEKRTKSFGQLKEETHKDYAWISAWDKAQKQKTGAYPMDYEDLIVGEDRDEIIEYMKATAQCAIL